MSNLISRFSHAVMASLSRTPASSKEETASKLGKVSVATVSPRPRANAMLPVPTTAPKNAPTIGLKNSLRLGEQTKLSDIVRDFGTTQFAGKELHVGNSKAGSVLSAMKEDIPTPMGKPEKAAAFDYLLELISREIGGDSEKALAILSENGCSKSKGVPTDRLDQILNAVHDLKTAHPSEAIKNAALRDRALLANHLMAKVTETRIQIARLFQQENSLNGMSVDSAASKLGELSIAKLPREARLKASQLMRSVDNDLHKLKSLTEFSAETRSVKLFGDGRDAKKELSTLLKDLISNSPLYKDKTLTDDQKIKEIKHLAWQFGNLANNNPDVKLAVGTRSFDVSSVGADLLQVFHDLEIHDSMSSDDRTFQLKLAQAMHIDLKENEECTASTVLHKALEGNLKVGTNKELLGQGSFGSVYKMEANQGTVIGKALRGKNSDETYREFSLHGQGLHNMPALRGVVTDDNNNSTFLMDHIAGDSLEKIALFKTSGASMNKAKACVHLLYGSLSGLNALHEKGLVHRDVKPANILFNRNNLEGVPIDLGEVAQAGTEGIAGSPAYMSPEIIDYKPAGTASDIFSLGVSFFELIVGETPRGQPNAYSSAPHPKTFTADEFHNFDEQKWPGELTPLRELLKVCMDPEPTNRPTAQQMLQALKGEPVTIAAEGQPGLKEGEIGILEALRPDGPFAGGLDVLAKEVGAVE